MRKSWLESRGRFISAAVVLAILGVSTVLRTPATIAGWESVHSGEQMSYPLYIWLSLSHGFLQFLWVVAAVILGLGGLIREEALGSSGFSLALPVSRRAHVLTRAGVGAAEAAVLAFIPGLIVVSFAMIGRSYPVTGSAFAGCGWWRGSVLRTRIFTLARAAGEYARRPSGWRRSPYSTC